MVGANSAGGNISIATGRAEFTDITFFNILAPTGGVVARVASVVHVSPGGGGFEFKFGECEPPPDRRAPGPPLADIEAAVDEIERIRA